MKLSKHHEEIVKSSPFPAAIFDKEKQRLISANQAILEAWGRTDAVLEQPLLTFMPELENQRYPKLLDQIIQSGRTWQEKQAIVSLVQSGQMINIAVDYSYIPLFESRGNTAAVLVLGSSSTSKIAGSLTFNSLQALLHTVEKSEAGLCVYRSPDFKVEAINKKMLDLWGGKALTRLDVLNHVYINCVPYTLNDKGQRYEYMPMVWDESGPKGVYVIAKMEK